MILRGVLLYTNNGIRLLCKDENGVYWTKEKCMAYCNTKDRFAASVRANRLVLKSILVDRMTKKGKLWYRDKDNFKEINFELKDNNLLIK